MRGSALSTSSFQPRSTVRQSSSCAANSPPSAITRSPPISSLATADTWRCSPHRRKRVENLLRISLPAENMPARADRPMEVGAPDERSDIRGGSLNIRPACRCATVGSIQLLSTRHFLVSQLKCKADKRRRYGPGRLDAGDEIAGHLRYPANPAPLPDGNLQRR